MLELRLVPFLALLINFLVLVYVLNIILFKPLLRLFAERENAIKGSLDAATELNKKKDDAVASMNQELKAAVGKSNEIFETMRKEGQERQKEILEGANKQALELIGTAKAELRTESDKTRQKLRADVEKFSDEIVKKLVGA
ncbi:MAG TPA: ATP synthase F0 subunit B [Thermodesulfovibrionales bacterium]|nr:ATP synthase F0 subunit B [Thermodesulfovibrionales bacterium]